MSDEDTVEISFDDICFAVERVVYPRLRAMVEERLDALHRAIERKHELAFAAWAATMTSRLDEGDSWKRGYDPDADEAAGGA